MAIDWDKHVLGPTITVFGDSVTYTPVTGSPFTATVVFDEAYQEVDIAGGMAITTQSPVAGVQLSVFPGTPTQGDQLTRNGSTYVVKEVRPDGHGWAKLLLNYLSP